MFNNKKLTREIEWLKQEHAALRSDNRILAWRIDNPAKYQVGKTYKGLGRCTDVCCKEVYTNFSLVATYKYFYKFDGNKIIES